MHPNVGVDRFADHIGLGHARASDFGRFSEQLISIVMVVFMDRPPPGLMSSRIILRTCYRSPPAAKQLQLRCVEGAAWAYFAPMKNGSSASASSSTSTTHLWASGSARKLLRMVFKVVFLKSQGKRPTQGAKSLHG